MTIITELGNMFAGMPTVNTVNKAAEESGDSFQDIISDMTKTQEFEYDYNEVAQTQQAAEEKKMTTVQETQESSGQDALDTKHEKAEGVDRPEETVVSDEKIAETEQKVLEETAKALGMTEEELVQKLEEMGIAILDLLNPQNVTALVAEVKADGDVSALLTNEELTALVKEINKTLEGVLTAEGQEVNLSGEEWKALIEKTITEKDAVKNVEEDATGSVVSENENSAADEGLQSVAEDADVVASKDVTGAEDADATVKTEIQPAQNKTENESAPAGNQENAFTSGEGNTGETAGAVNQSEMVTGNAPVSAPENFAQILTEDIPTMGAADPQEIVSQVLDQMKMQVKEDVTQLSMQLNPENLGTVNLTVASKEGNVTAQLFAQNDAVRAALEAQILVLKENLEQQGVKVDAIEVAVASHEFERNLEQGNEGNRQQDDMAEELKKATRKIDLNGIAELDELEDLAEEEIVTAKMMQADGNTMDYKV